MGIFHILDKVTWMPGRHF